MKALILSVILAIPALTLSAAPASAQHAHHHDHAGDTATNVVAVPQHGWATDAPLREGMQRVRAALGDLQHYPSADMGVATALQHVAEIKDAAAFMFAHCQLPENPDQALHGMLVPLLSAAQKFEADPTDTSQVKAMQHAVANYPHYFDDPAWPAPSGSAPGTP